MIICSSASSLKVNPTATGEPAAVDGALIVFYSNSRGTQHIEITSMTPENNPRSLSQYVYVWLRLCP